jgi:hypothetical protein
MKKLLLIAFLVIMALILTHRQRVFVRDPLAKVYASTGKNGSDSVEQPGVQVYINYSNDVLLIKESSPAYTLLVQHWNRTPGFPTELKCIHWMACLTDADQAATRPVPSAGTNQPKVQMSDTTVSFVDPKGALTRVQLR